MSYLTLITSELHDTQAFFQICCWNLHRWHIFEGFFFTVFNSQGHQPVSCLSTPHFFCMAETAPLDGWAGELKGSNNMGMSQQFALPCEKPNTVAVSGRALLSQYPYCCIPNALCAVSLITECVGCNSCYSFYSDFSVLSSYQRTLAAAFVGLPCNYFWVTFS